MGAHTCFPLVNYKFAIGQGHKHLVIQIPEKKEVTMQFQSGHPGAKGLKGTLTLVLRVYLFLFFTLKVCVCGRGPAAERQQWKTHSWPWCRPLFCIFPGKEGPAEQG